MFGTHFFRLYLFLLHLNWKSANTISAYHLCKAIIVDISTNQTCSRMLFFFFLFFSFLSESSNELYLFTSDFEYDKAIIFEIYVTGNMSDLCEYARSCIFINCVRTYDCLLYFVVQIPNLLSQTCIIIMIHLALTEWCKKICFVVFFYYFSLECICHMSLHFCH